MPYQLLFDTPLGRVGLAYDPGPDGPALLAVALPAQTDAATLRALAASVRARGEKRPLETAPSELPGAIAASLDAIRAALSDDAASATSALEAVPLDLRGLTPFRRLVYEHARRIPRGHVVTYGELARAAGASRAAARAVGRAMATNPWPIVVPCHRVVGSEGDLHGFSAPGGLKTKASLLALEGARPAEGARRSDAADRTRRRADDQPGLPFERTSSPSDD